MNYQLQKYIKQNFKKPASALDLGCGKGDDVNWFKKNGWIAKGVDIKNGTDLEKLYTSPISFNLIYSNYVIQFIKNKKTFFQTCYNNLKPNGKLFIQTFDITDKILKQKLTEDKLRELFETEKFTNINIYKFAEFDKEHNHWHKILKATAQKK